MTCKTIFEKRGRYCFYEADESLRKFLTLEDAKTAGGVEEEVSVSGVPYKVDSSDVKVETDEE